MIERNIKNFLTQQDLDVYFHPNRTNPNHMARFIAYEDVLKKMENLNLYSHNDIPLKFDWRKQKGVILTPPMNQGHCGNCWAIASTQSFSDRFMIASKKTGIVLDPLPTTICAKPGNGCGGGLPESCQDFFANIGASQSKDKCMSWNNWCMKTPNCCDNCNEKNSSKMPNILCSDLDCNGYFKSKPNSMHSGTVITDGKVDIEKTIHSIKVDIMLHGPVVAKFQVFGDFMVADAGLVVAGGKSFQWESTNGIYINGYYNNELSQSFTQLSKDTLYGHPEKLKILKEGYMPHFEENGMLVGISPSEKSMGFHAVEIVGWDVDDKWGEYWIIKNSWGDKWNDDGYFKFGINNDGIRNSKCGMDIPIIMKDGTLFGGTVSFIPLLDSNIISYMSGTNKNNFWIWILIVTVIIIIILLLLFYYFRQKNTKYKTYYSPNSYSPNTYTLN